MPHLLGPLSAPPGAVAPIARARLLEALRALYEHHPRPKEFIVRHRVAEALRALLEAGGGAQRGEDAARLEAQKLLGAFHVNVLL